MSSVPTSRAATLLPVRSLTVACAVAASAVGVALAPSAASAAAVVNSPPANGHSIIVFPQRDFIHADGYAATDRLTVDDIRNGVVIASAAGVAPVDDPTTALYDGMFDLNHLGVPCWDNVTPDILPGDIIRITDQNGVADETPTANVTVTQPATDTGGGLVVMKGTAADAAGAPLAAGSFEARVIAKNLRFAVNNKRDIRATPVYDSPTSTSWTARWTLTANDVKLAVGGESRDLWLGRAPGVTNALGSPIESTIYEYAALGGPAAGCAAAPQASYAVTSSTPASLNAATNAGDLVLSGASQDATSVTVTLTDSTGAQVTSAPATPTPATGAQTWSVTIPAAAHNTLAQGTLTAAGSYTLAAGSLTGATKTVLKDIVAPTAPIATPPGGSYATPQAVTLSNAENLPMFTTVDGSTPTPGSAGYTTQLQITASQTLQAIAVDPAGNVSPVATNAYTIVIGTVPGAPATAGATAGDATATVSWTPPTNNGGQPIRSYRVHALTAGAQPADVIVPAPGTTATFGGLTNGTAYAFDVLATNAVGEGAAARTGAVTPAAAPVAPGAPIIGTATAGVGSASVGWTAPASTGGAPITGYTVKATDTGTGAWVSAPAAATATSGTVAGLTAGRSYTLTVTATNAANLTGASSAASNAVTVPTAPAAPAIGLAVAGVTTDTVVSATAKWTRPTSSGGSAITRYSVTADRYTGTTLTSSTTKTAGATVATLKFTGLVSGATYKFRVRAVNAVGTSTFSASSNLVTAR